MAVDADMRGPFAGFGLRVRHLAGAALWLALACLVAGCEQMVTKEYSHDVGDLSRADRIDVTYEAALNPRSGKVEARAVERVSDPQRIAKVAALVRRYQDGWTTVLSGSPGRALTFREGDRELTQIGVFESGITHDGKARTLTPAEVVELVGLLGVPWPPQDSPDGRPDKAR